MPTYAYECQKCGHAFERFQNMKDLPVEICPECGGEVRRLLSAGAGIIVKGSGGSATGTRKSDTGAPPCGAGRTCCGRDTRCDSPPCSD